MTRPLLGFGRCDFSRVIALRAEWVAFEIKGAFSGGKIRREGGINFFSQEVPFFRESSLKGLKDLDLDRSSSCLLGNC